MNTRGKVWFQTAPFVWAALLFGAILAIACLTGQLRSATAASLSSLQPLPVGGTLGEQEKVTTATQSSAEWDDRFGFTGVGSLDVRAIAVSGNDIYVGGRFTTTFGDKYPNQIAEWNGTEFLAFGKGVNTIIDGTVFAVAVGANGDVYIGGNFTHVAGKPANKVARWDGTDWHALGAGADSSVFALATNGDNVFIGGAFNRAGGLSANYIARWNRPTQTWAALGTGVNSSVHALAFDQGTLYVGGSFSAAGSVTASKLARWDGANWAAFGATPPEFSDRVFALAVAGNIVYIGGELRALGPRVAANAESRVHAGEPHPG